MEDNDYVSYLLRLRKSEVHGRPCWRVTLESIQSGEKRSFDLEGLLAFLRTHFGTEEGPEPLFPSRAEADAGEKRPEAGQNEPWKGGAPNK